MMRIIYSVCLLIAAMGLPVVAGTASDGGASCGKGGCFKIAGVPLLSSSPSDSTAGLSHATVTVPNGGRLARVTAYWPAEGDYYTRHNVSATGVRLHDGHCAVDPNIIPYGSVVAIAGLGTFLAVDTGTAVVERTAAREGGHTYAEKHALVIDLFFQSRREGEAFAASAAKWASINWWTPGQKTSDAKTARGMFADEDWQKIESKQL
ncbi:MAG TPA: 3D domain-containing protein [Candidatus Methylacidiphilales bacterium]|jgi:3D (Asp-Asp-Asp) domain-containing protein|nr:3D domain-containing protein [Candidatus Methylacidiphilales bacterium]